jgi:catechol 2,3-dioxygenase-like lactoylglutathione lyase family enzyme
MKPGAAIAHLTLPTRNVEATATFLERTLGLSRLPPPTNSPIEVVWLDLGGGQSAHVFHAPGFALSDFEGEFGRHIALYYPLAGFADLKARLAAERVQTYAAERSTPFERFFFRDPVNGYVFEIVDGAQRNPRAGSG